MKLYVLTRRDLSASQQAVQAGHGVAELLLRGQPQSWDNGTLVYLGVDSEKELLLWRDKLKYRDIPFSEFREPDIGDQLTALACVSDGKIFSNLKLL